MSNFLIIVFCLFAGYLLRRWGVVKPDGFKAINSWIIYVGLPATSFRYLPELHWDNQLLLCLVTPIFILAGSIFFVKYLGRWLGLSIRTTHTLMLVCGFANTSFVGFPLVASYFGNEQIKWAIISDQMTFFLLSSVGTVIAIKGGMAGRDKIPVTYLLKRVIRFPPLIGCMLALILSRFLDLTTFQPFFAQLASTVSPLALFSIGIQLSFVFYRSELTVIAWSLAYKLILGPAILIIICNLLQFRGEVAQIANFEMSMPSLVATSLLLQEFRLNTKLGNSIIGLSILIGLFSTWFAYRLIMALL
ncbi:AEC family transporter [Sphingobacterium suaedae]|uniref:AEC family transporter n=1 Tax=Sphingobacterium suaedae TaxID=1686402 RepID=A0ABW5KI55_9SPHI